MNARFSTLFLWLLMILLPSKTNAQTARFSSAEIRGDLAFLRSELERWHPNLYTYSEKTEVDACFDGLFQSIPDSMTAWEAYGFFTSVCAVIRDGHTLFYPDEKNIAYHDLHSGFFPFKTWWDGRALYVAMNYTSTTEIPDGAEIISINHVAAADIMQHTLPRMMYDGKSQTYSVWVMNNWFYEYYSYFYGHPETFEIVFRPKGGSTVTKTVRALRKEEIFANREKNYPQVPFGKKEKDGLLLDIDVESKTAVLTIKDFHADILKKYYKQRFKKTITGYFARIKESGVQHLILDVRNNQGGSTKYSKLLLSHLLDRPFQLMEGFNKVDKSAASDVARRLKKCGGPTPGIYRPRSDAFKGDLFVLINGGSFSNTGILSSALQHYGRAVFVGEETGGSKHLLSADVRYKTLPHTRIRVEIPTLQFVIRDKHNNTGHGVIPEHAVQPEIGDVVRHNDVVKAFALELIRKGQKGKQ